MFIFSGKVLQEILQSGKDILTAPQIFWSLHSLVSTDPTGKSSLLLDTVTIRTRPFISGM